MFGRAKRDANAAAFVERWTGFADDAHLDVIHVVRIEQWCRNGTIAWVHREGESRVRDGFVWCRRATAGELLVGRAGEGYGWITNRPDVLYVNDVHAVLTPKVLRRAERHRQREQRVHSSRGGTRIRRRPRLVGAYDD